MMRRSLRWLATCPGMDLIYNPTDDHRQLRDTVSRFATEEVGPQALEHDVKGSFNRSLFKRAGELGLLGVTVPEAVGGAGMDATAAVIIHHELSKQDPGFCLAYLAHSMLFVNNLYYAGNDKQRAKYLPKMCSGEHVGAMGMSEPMAGTDVLGMRTTATKTPGGDYVLNGSKIWITNGDVADVYLVYAKVDGKITSFLVERGMKGFTNGPKIDKCGMRASTMCELHFDNVLIPQENVVGTVGKGVVNMMRNLEIERLTLGAMAIGIADRCVDEMLQYANTRTAFGHKISNYGQIQRYVAESFAECEAAKVLTYTVSRSVAPGLQNRIGSDAVKLFSAPMAKRVADNAIQVAGGIGYSKGMPLERLWRDAKLLEIGGGTLEAHHKNLVKDLTAGLGK
eukprot:PhF_6_TR30683/c0_g1_i1/m.45144/K00253/IVD, ivd; isovaleryl-CoA dehydrogenase